MRSVVVLVDVGAAGCGNSSTPSGSSKPPADPNIRVKESINGGAGPVGGGRSREYEGPASQAPEWAKPKSGGK